MCDTEQNHVGRAGAAAFIAALKTNSSLLSLSMSAIDFDYRSSQLIATYLVKDHSAGLDSMLSRAITIPMKGDIQEIRAGLSEGLKDSMAMACTTALCCCR